LCKSDAFSVLTPESCYWAGVLASDGYVRRRYDSTFIVGLKVDDESLVVSFKNFLQTEATIHHGARPNGKSWFCLNVTDVTLFSDLCALGIVPNKSLTIKVVPRLIASRDFWRGVVDGDGSLCIKSTGYFCCTLCSASWDFICQFKEFLATIEVIRKITVDARKKSPLYSIQLSGWQARRLVRELYQDCCMALDRKLSIAERVMSSGSVRLVGVTAKEDTGACKQNLGQ
jgi:hypothetical protein